LAAIGATRFSQTPNSFGAFFIRHILHSAPHSAHCPRGEGATFEVGVPGLTADLEDPYQRLLGGPAYLDQQTMIVT
jgi:hypothetical protein